MSHPLLLGGTTSPDPTIKIARSLRFRRRATAALNRAVAVQGNRRLWSFSAWVRRGMLGQSYNYIFGTGPDGFNYSALGFASDQLWFQEAQGGGASGVLRCLNYSRDPSAWMHVVAVWDSANATASERMRLYVNGARVTEFATATYPAQNLDSIMNYPYGSAYNWIGRYSTTPDAFDGNLADVHFLDGIAATPEMFGQANAATGQWQPKTYSGSHGQNGYWLDFSDPTSPTTLCYDRSGNSNHWTPNNISTTAGITYDSLTDTPTNVYPILNDAAPAYSVGYIQDGGLANLTSTSIYGSNYATLGMYTGKWYCEVTSGDAYGIFGVCVASEILQTRTSSYLGSTAYSWGYGQGYKYNNGGSAAWGGAVAANNVIGIYYDADAGTLGFTKNGVDLGIAFTGVWASPSDTMVFGVGDPSANYSCSAYFNFGQQPFRYTPPSGFKALCTENLSKPTILRGDDAFKAITYTGTGANRDVKGLRFSPGMTWIKNRQTNDWAPVFDAVRGPLKPVFPTSTQNQLDQGGLYQFLSDGFSVDGQSWVNGNGNGMVAWNWREGAAYGMDTVVYQGTGALLAVPHALGQMPYLMIVKRLDVAGNWKVYCPYWIGKAQYMHLNEAGGIVGDTTVWGNTDPNATHIYVGTHADTNAVGGWYVAYLFCSKPGFSRVGWYQGNGAAQGPFVHLGFRPAFTLIKCVQSGGYWGMLDTARSTVNPVNHFLRAEITTPETTSGNTYDVCATGFTVRTASGSLNVNGMPHLFLAMADRPAKYVNAR